MSLSFLVRKFPFGSEGALSFDLARTCSSAYSSSSVLAWQRREEHLFLGIAVEGYARLQACAS